jgi:hypothetical protein
MPPKSRILESSNDRTTVIRHEKSKMPTAVNAYQVTQLALEFCRKADGTIDTQTFETNWQLALRHLRRIQEALITECTQPDEHRTNNKQKERKPHFTTHCSPNEPANQKYSVPA